MSGRTEVLTALHGSMMGWRPWGLPAAGTFDAGRTPVMLTLAPGETKTVWIEHPIERGAQHWLKDRVAFVWRLADAARGGSTWLDEVRVLVLSRGAA